MLFKLFKLFNYAKFEESFDINSFTQDETIIVKIIAEHGHILTEDLEFALNKHR